MLPSPLGWYFLFASTEWTFYSGRNKMAPSILNGMARFFSSQDEIAHFIPTDIESAIPFYLEWNGPFHSSWNGMGYSILSANFWIPTTRIMRMILRPESFPLSVTTDQNNLENGVDSGPRNSSILHQGSHPKNEMSQIMEKIT